MLTIECDICGRLAKIKGYCTDDTFEEPGEVIIDDKENFSSCCYCIQHGGQYTIIDSTTQTFDDDVI